jgi:hypothetical protein
MKLEINTQTNDFLRKYSVMIMVVLAAFMFSCGGNKSASGEQAETEEVTEADDQSSGGMTFKEEDIKALKDKFIFDEEAGYYYHKHWNKSWPKRRTLTADVNKTGYYYLCSNLYGNKGLNHDMVEVKFGEETMKTDKIDRKNASEHQTQKTDKGTFEVNYYTNYRDKGIFDRIGKSENGKDIVVRFVAPGYTSYADEPLPQSDYEALKDCYQLSLVLRYEAAQGGQ